MLLENGLKNMRLFIDDTRVPRQVGLPNEDYTIVRDYATAIAIIELFAPQVISFDHDLQDYDKSGKEWTGYDIAKTMIEYDRHIPIFTKQFQYNVHSMNPVGKKNIENLLSDYMYHKWGVISPPSFYFL